MKKLSSNKKAGLILLLLTAGIQSCFAQEVSPEVASSFPSVNLLAMGAVLMAELLVILFLLIKIRSLLDVIDEAPAKPSFMQEVHLPKLFDNINDAVAVEKEAEVMTDHEYDGIRELDNNLPPWWKWSFYISIVWSFVYLLYFHVFGAGALSGEEYEREMERSKLAVEEYKRKMKDQIDENNVLMPDAGGITSGAKLFAANCVACHGQLAEGNSVGPNLTDEYWLHGGSLNDIYRSIKYGIPANGMKAWQTDFSPSQIRDLSGYVYSLKGSNPPSAKEPQGTRYKENPDSEDTTDERASAE